MKFSKAPYYFLGLTLWLPGISIFDIGNSSLQISVLIAALIIILYYKLIDKYLINLLVIFLLYVTLQIFYLIFFKDEFILLIKGFIFFIPSIIIIISGYITIKSVSYYDFYNGYLIGGVVSAIIGILQYIFWKFFLIDLPFLEFLNNNKSFSMYYYNSDKITALRIFSLMPEPSLLFINLTPLLFINLFYKKYLLFLLFFIASILSGSVNIFLTFLVYFYIIFLYKLKLNFFFNIFISLILMGLVLFYIDHFYSISLDNEYQFQYYENIIDRIKDLPNNGSILSRLNSIYNAVNLFIQNPVFGLGIQGDELSSYLAENSTSIEVNIGINSILFSILVWFGFFGILFFIPTVLFINRQSSIHIKIFISSIIISSIFALSYYNFYTFWLAIGITLFHPNSSKTLLHAIVK